MVLARAAFTRELGQAYAVVLTVRGEVLSLCIDGREVLTATDATFGYGQAGLRMASAGRMTVARLEIEGL